MYAGFLKSMLSDRVKRHETVTKLPYLTVFTKRMFCHIPNPKKKKNIKSTRDRWRYLYTPEKSNRLKRFYSSLLLLLCFSIWTGRSSRWIVRLSTHQTIDLLYLILYSSPLNDILEIFSLVTYTRDSGRWKARVVVRSTSQTDLLEKPLSKESNTNAIYFQIIIEYVIYTYG